MFTLEKAQTALQEAEAKIREHVEGFYPDFPDVQSQDYVYPKSENIEWTPGFYVGLLMLAYEYTKNPGYIPYIEGYIDSFQKRIDERIGTATHDLGFLYTLSCVGARKLFGWEKARRTALSAADCLLERWKEKGSFIQAWGSIEDRRCYRLIIDCLLNLPLLFWASEETGADLYRQRACQHAKTCATVIVRPDATTFHTFFFDPDTGLPLRGETGQGYSDDSCWARGQAWGVYGFALCYHYTKEPYFLELYDKVTDYFISRLGADSIPYWDLCFTEGAEPRDTSAAAIAVCGILEMSKYIDRPAHIKAAETMLETLSGRYSTKDMPESNGLLTDGMYSRPGGNQPECTLWGDYFYMEALTRYTNRDWRMYW